MKQIVLISTIKDCKTSRLRMGCFAGLLNSNGVIMFESAIAINQFQLGMMEKIAADLPSDVLNLSHAGHAHSPAWIMGHLAITGEMGVKMLGGEFTHPEWIPMFGPGSIDPLPAPLTLTMDDYLAANLSAYNELQQRALTADPVAMQERHTISFFEQTPVQTVGDAMTLLLTNHFGFHLGQLSSCRRERGLSPLF